MLNSLTQAFLLTWNPRFCRFCRFKGLSNWSLELSWSQNSDIVALNSGHNHEWLSNNVCGFNGLCYSPTFCAHGRPFWSTLGTQVDFMYTLLRHCGVRSLQQLNHNYCPLESITKAHETMALLRVVYTMEFGPWKVAFSHGLSSCSDLKN